ncbi:hypothetical protein Ancab_023887 [Ancistrocladus abbreviatus]
MATRVQENHGASCLSPPADDVDNSCNLKRKTPLQLQTLENLYTEDKYPTQSRMEDYAFALGLTYKQVRGWFIERRRKEKKDNSVIGCRKKGEAKKKKKKKKKCSNLERGEDGIMRRPILLQDMLYTPDYILKEVFREDGPPLGVEFDPVPTAACRRRHDTGNICDASDNGQGVSKRRKVSELAMLECQQQNNISVPVKKHGMGKGLMTVWNVMNAEATQKDRREASKIKKVPPGTNSCPSERHGIGKGLMTVWQALNHGCNFADRGAANVLQVKSSRLPKSVQNRRQPVKNRKPRQKSVAEQRRSRNKLQRKKKVECNRNEYEKKMRRESCGLALDVARCEEHVSSFAMLLDDEELELRELQSGPNPLTCTAHFAMSGRNGCPLCKGLLAKFPPDSVRMKNLLPMQPWNSSMELVKKLFKVFHFLYTYAVLVDVCPFTLDEFAQAFHDKDSLLLGKIHMVLLEQLLSDVEKEVSDGFFPHMAKNCMFLNLLQSVDTKKFVVDSWKKSLNPLTWTEILRQVLVAAGFGSRDGILRKEAFSKEVNPVVKYGLCPGTLKGELFRILLEQGNKGIKVIDLAKSSQIADLGLASTNDELEGLICSTLARDIKLFEKISSSAYRLRLNSFAKEDESSDTEDSGSIDDSSKYGGVCSNDDFEYDSGNSSSRTHKKLSQHYSEKNIPHPCTEIDESHPGEAWLLGLMEGEYSDLSIEEKLDALLALVDLLSAGSSIRMEDPVTPLSVCVPMVYQHGFGAKIKRSSLKPHHLPGASWGQVGEIHGSERADSLSEFQTIDSSASLSLFNEKEKSSTRKNDGNEAEAGTDLHPMQSIFLGSDRRYNRYWLFLGPCNGNDPGHRRVYFESSEDGRWEVIDTEDALCALLAVLDNRGRREAVLLASLERRSALLYEEMSSSRSTGASIRRSTHSDISELDRVNEDSSSPISDVDNNLCSTDISQSTAASSDAIVFEAGQKVEEQKQKWTRLQAYDSWIWSSFYSNLYAVRHRKRSYFDTLTRCRSCHDLYWRDEKHCKTCHTTFELDFDLEEKYVIHAATCREKEDSTRYPTHKVLCSQLQALKAAIHAIEVTMPEAALLGAWTKSRHQLWVKRLRRTSSFHELSQVLADFVNAINVDWVSECNMGLDCDTTLKEIVACFSSLPQTSSAFAFWLVKLDASIASHLGDVPEVSRTEGKRARDS